MTETGMAAAEVRRAPSADGPAVSTRWRLLTSAAGHAGTAINVLVAVQGLWIIAAAVVLPLRRPNARRLTVPAVSPVVAPSWPNSMKLGADLRCYHFTKI
jgi:hypothetical protein